MKTSTVCAAVRGLHCWLPIGEMGTPARALCARIGLTTVAISDPPASRSDARTVEGALARMQSGVPTKGVRFSGEGASQTSRAGRVKAAAALRAVARTASLDAA